MEFYYTTSTHTADGGDGVKLPPLDLIFLNTELSFEHFHIPNRSFILNIHA